MAKLRDKFNVLVQSGLRGALPADRPKRRKPGSVERDITALREQINRALDDEDRLTAEIAALRKESEEWDRQADGALQRGDEAGARHAVQQMRRAQQRAGLLEADLAQHRYMTSDLIRRVNTLESIAAEVEAKQAESATKPGDDEEQPLAARLRQDLSAAPDSPSPVHDTRAAAHDEAVDQPDAQAIEDDLARRRARLSL